MEHSVLVAFVLYFLAAEAVILAGCWRLFGPRRTGSSLSRSYVNAVLGGQVLIPLCWQALKMVWVMLTDVQRADVLAVLHVGFMAPVVVLQVLIVVGGVWGWKWVRNYRLRMVHLVAISLVVTQAALGHECPVNEFERGLRGGDLANLEGASAIGRFCNRLIYYRVEDVRIILIPYAVFGVVVIASWYWVRPDAPHGSPGR
ncbi:MAG: DUF2784 family protein [Planctomycetia bacterium]|nr:DUF2784 family protein [Planctomycetia bacterium]